MNKQLAEIWPNFDDPDIAFAAINVRGNIVGGDSKVVDIGFAYWSPGRSRTICCSQWHVEDDMEYSVSYQPRKLAFSLVESVFISKSEIGPTLNEIIESLSTSFKRLYLIGFDIDGCFEMLQSHWEPPPNIVILDTQEIWRSQTLRSEQISFEYALRDIGVEYDQDLLEEIGQEAIYNLHLFESLGQTARTHS
ncbi:hypothetical protein F5Y10DRAFT_265719 [Nemania abortiva]|nr:hypothetical protein F5Y10DRAFT_265719 [Nemania abortiva]